MSTKTATMPTIRLATTRRLPRFDECRRDGGVLRRAAAREVGFREEVLPLILKDNAAKLLGLA